MLFRKPPRITEAEAYERCYGARTDTVRVLGSSEEREKSERVSGEDLRRGLEARLDARESEAA